MYLIQKKNQIIFVLEFINFGFLQNFPKLSNTKEAETGLHCQEEEMGIIEC